VPSVTAKRTGFIEPMLASLADAPPEGDDWLHELKYDGYRTELALWRGDGRAYTRRGHDWSYRYEPLLIAAGALDSADVLIDGEVVLRGPDGLPDFNALRREVRKPEPKGLTFMAFDLLHLDGRDLRRQPIEDRRERLRELLSRADQPLLRFSDDVRGNGPAFFEAAERIGAEGIVSKKLGSRYKSGRSHAWLKVKAMVESEFLVIGATTGDLAPRALLARETEEHSLEYVGAAMVTLPAPDRERFWRASERLRIPKPALHVERMKETTWLKPEMRVKVVHLRGEEPLRHATIKAITYAPK
jgi:DNA ligase D-like protein (predicted ligase)